MRNIDIHNPSVKAIDPSIIANGMNTCINIDIPGREITGGTLRERCTITGTEAGITHMINEDLVLEVAETEEVTLWVMEDVILVMSDIRLASNEEDGTAILPTSETDLNRLTGVDGVEIHDLR
jgi:hypothetical protein